MNEVVEQVPIAEKEFKIKLNQLKKEKPALLDEYTRRLMGVQIDISRTIKGIFQADLELKKRILNNVIIHPEPEWFNRKIEERKAMKKEAQPKVIEPSSPPSYTKEEFDQILTEGPQIELPKEGKKDNNTVEDAEKRLKEKQEKIEKAVDDWHKWTDI